MGFKLNLKHENKDVEKFEVFHTILHNDKTGESLAEEYVGMIQDGRYTVSLQAFCKYGSSKWSQPITIEKNDEVRHFMLFLLLFLLLQREL